MDFCTSEKMPLEELALRHGRCRALLAELCPEASGLLVFGRSSVYYLTGSMGNGMLWLPRAGEPVLMVRKGAERCRLESPLNHICSFKSYGEIARLCSDAGSPLGTVVAAEKSALPWSLATMLQSRLNACRFVGGDAVLAQAQAVKTAWEMHKIERAGLLHAQALHELLPPLLHAGLSERAIAHLTWEVFFAEGHAGMLRAGGYDEEIFLGSIAVGDNGNYPVPHHGPVGSVGEHPAIPFMGYAGSVWQKGQPLLLDVGFLYEGYHTDMSTVYFAGGAHSVPDVFRRAQGCCADIVRAMQPRLKPGQSVAALWHEAQRMAAGAGFAEGFMGHGDNQLSFLGHGIGLAMAQWPVLADNDAVLEEHMTLALEPKIGLPGLGMAGVEEVFAVTPEGGRCLTGMRMDIHCVER